MATMGKCTTCKIRWSWTKERQLLWTRCPVCETTLRPCSEWHEWPERVIDDRDYPSYYDLKTIIGFKGCDERKENNNKNKFQEQWDETKKEIPPDKMRSAYSYLVGAMGGHVPRHKVKPIIAGAVAFVKGENN